MSFHWASTSGFTFVDSAFAWSTFYHVFTNQEPLNNILSAPTVEETAQHLSDVLPQGRAWGRKNDETSNTRKLINSLAIAPNIVRQKIGELDFEYRIGNTTLLLSEWETSVGLPSECAKYQGSLEQRRNEIIERLRRKSLVTLADMQAYVDSILPDIEIILYAGEDYTSYPSGFPDGINKKFLIVAEVQVPYKFEYTFEYPFVNGVDTVELECRMNKVIPANVNFLVYYI